MAPRVWAEIDVAAIRDNLAAIRSYVGPTVEVMAVVKANAYGHGIEIVSRAAADAGARWFGVATAEEGAVVRKEVPNGSICLLSPFVPGEESDIVGNGLVPLISSANQVMALASECELQGRSVEVHLEIDTGMGRSGIAPTQTQSIAATIRGLPSLRLTGAATHFPCGDTDPEFSRNQAKELERLADDLQTRGIHLETIHALNSGGVLLTPVPEFNLARPGLLLYGIRPISLRSVGRPEVRPVLTLKTRIALIRQLPAGHSVSYGRAHILTRESRVATLPVGYGDGYPRDLSNRGAALIRGKRAPILGRVCMDMTVVDVSDIEGAEEGDEVVLIGAQASERITVEEVAEAIGTTEHDVTTRLTHRVLRVPVEPS